MQKEQVVKNICEYLKSEGIVEDYRYDHFTESEAVLPPFVVYRRVAPNNFSADGIVYQRGQNIDLEVYASDPDEMANIMEAIEEKLTESELFYQLTADTVYIDSEEFYETLYEL